MNRVPVRYGLDMLLSGMVHELLGQKIGLVTNMSATTGTAYHNLVPIREALIDAGIELAAVYMPPEERTDLSDRTVDPIAGVPFYDLSAILQPSNEAADDTGPVDRLATHFGQHDLILFDLPDIGSRFYSHIWILYQVMEACQQASRPLWILDRPNPLSGNLLYAEGPMLEPALHSPVGRWSMPLRHCLTIGELAWMWRVERDIRIEFNVVKMGGWQRGMFWPELGNPFVPPSPEIASYETTLIYGATAPLVASNVSVGLGSWAPFRQIGAPWIDAHALSQRFNAHDLLSVSARPVHFIPTQGIYQGESCHGVMLHPLDVSRLFPVKIGLWLLADLLALFPQEFRWGSPESEPQDALATGGHSTLYAQMIGRSDIEAALTEHPDDLPQLIQRWTQTPGWVDTVLDYLLYSD